MKSKAIIVGIIVAGLFAAGCGSDTETKSSSVDITGNSATAVSVLTDSETDGNTTRGDGSAVAITAKNESSQPYLAVMTGTYHHLIAGDGMGTYSLYLPSTLEQCASGVMIVPPGDQNAEQFLNSEIGKQWIDVSEKNAVALCIAESSDGGWGQDTGRDEVAYLKAVADQFHSKSNTLRATLDLDERAFYLVGYGDGSTPALEYCMTWGCYIAGASFIDGYALSDDQINTIGNQISQPFAMAGGKSNGSEENDIPNKDVNVPVWLVNASDDEKNPVSVVDYWVAANDAEKANENGIAQEVYDSDKGSVWVTDKGHASEVTPEVVYSSFLCKTMRFVGDPNGRIAETIQHTNDGTHGYFLTETEIDGQLRRWYTYVPSSYDGDKMPLVVAIHGYSSDIDAFTGDTRWADVAESEGCLVVFPQAYTSRPVMGNINAPVWNTYSFPLGSGQVDDESFIKQMIEQTEGSYSVDTQKIYATGHSNGATMTWALAQDLPDLFAAVAPVGHNSGSYKNCPTRSEDLEPSDTISQYSSSADKSSVIPIWSFKGTYDADGGSGFEQTGDSENSNLAAMTKWTAKYGLDFSNPSETTKDDTGRFETTFWKNANGVPLIQYTVVDNSPHAYMPEEAEMIYTKFFAKYSRSDNGALCYEGNEVK